LVVKREGTILVATERGFGKRTDVIQYRTQTRGGKGVLTMRCTEKTGKMVSIMEVVDSDDLIVITDAGVLMRQPIAAIRTIGRVTQGVKLPMVRIAAVGCKKRRYNSGCNRKRVWKKNGCNPIQNPNKRGKRRFNHEVYRKNR
jgi:DNA gyrase/topoisomerase IV subunit A